MSLRHVFRIGRFRFGLQPQRSIPTALQRIINQLDQLRRQIAERVDLLAGNNDAELARLRARLGNAKNGAKPGSTKVVVDDDQPKPKKKLKPAQQQSQQ